MTPETPHPRHPVIEVLMVFLRLGCTSFGGPVAHLGYFHQEFVARRAWLAETAYADLLALCQFLPGPASSQLGMAIGLHRAGPLGMCAAWLGFTLPSALLMAGFAIALPWLGAGAGGGCLHGLKLVAVAVVAQAVWGMARSLCPDRARASLAAASCVLVLSWPGPLGQVVALILGGLVGLRLASGEADQPPAATQQLRRAWLFLLAFCVLLVGLPLTWPEASAFYRAGALVFGGGHLVLPLLRDVMVGPGLVSSDVFLAGYGAAQAMPGPLFTFASFLGTALPASSLGVALLQGLVATVAIFLPSFLLIPGVLPIWRRVRGYRRAQNAVRGVNAATVGLLLAALYAQVWVGTIVDDVDFSVALVAFVALTTWRAPPWAVVILGAVAGALVS